MLRKKREINLNRTDVRETAHAFKWVCKKHLVGLEYQGVDIDIRLIREDDHLVTIELRPDADQMQTVWHVHDGQPDRYWAPSAQIKFEVPPLSAQQEVTLYIRPLKPSDPKPAPWERLVQEIFDSFEAYVRDKEYLVHGPQSPMPIEDVAGVGETALPDWFPKKPETLERWGRAYSFMVELAEEYYQRYLDEEEQPKPKIAEYASKVAYEMKWKPSSKTVGRIKEAGDKGWLE